jgi:Chromo (CHRromatin Organisation MOdifier) domain
MAHGPNYARPPPDIVNREEEHYKVKKVLQSCPTPNRKGVQYLIKWKGYPNSENSWLPATQMKHAAELVKQFHSKFPKAPRPPSIRSLQVQQDLKEGMLSRTVTLEPRRHMTVGRSHDQTGSDPPRDQSRDQAPKPASNQSCDKEREHDLMHAYFCRRNLCYVHDRY